jgi:hypothetical protein
MFDFCGLFFARLDGGRKILVLFIRVHSCPFVSIRVYSRFNQMHWARALETGAKI